MATAVSGFIGDAPNDGTQYGRQSHGWTPVVGGGGGGGGNVTGPVGAVADHIATYNGTTGLVIKDGGVAIAALTPPVPATAAPIMDGTAAVGAATKYAREDHVHPTDTSRAAVSALPIAATATPIVESGTGAVGTSVKYAREDHVHPLGPGGGGGVSVTISDTPPASPAVGALWWESDTGLLYIRFNDGTSSQWVIAAPQADITTFVQKSGDTMTGPLILSADPTAALGAATKQYVDAAVSRNLIGGLTLSTAGSSTVFAVAPGVAADSNNIATMALASVISKTTTVWNLGNGGSLDTGTIAASTWYHVHLIKRADTGVVDVLVSLSVTAPTLPTNYSLFRRIGSLLTNVSSQWVSFSQLGDEFIWSVPVGDISTTTLGTTATLFVLSVPTGLQVLARIRGYVELSNAAANIELPA